MTASLRIAVLISGGGTTLRNLLTLRERGELPVEIVLVVSSNPAAGGIEFARQAGVPVVVRERRQYHSADDYGAAIFADCRLARVDLVVMGGFLKLVTIPADFVNRVINVHPSLIPAFCGTGFYGLRVHQAVLDYGARVTGCTVHFVDNQYDHGPIILQRVVEVQPEDTAESLQRQVFAEECRALPEVIRLIATGRVQIANRRVVIVPAPAS